MNKEKEQQLRDAFRQKTQRIQDASRGARTNNKSLDWFKNILKRGFRAKKTATPVPGGIYAFAYDAKHKDTLPYWDKFPLSICLSVRGDRWLSINLHYLPPKMRADILEELLINHANAPTRRSGKLNERTRLNINWSKMKNFNPKIAQHAITSYLFTNIKTPIQEVNPADWYMAVGLPLQQFMSKGKRFSARKVWRGAR